MGLAIIRVMVISQQADYGMHIKQLAQRGGYEITTFTAPRDALDHLRRQRQHVALVDFDHLEISGEVLVRELRAIQPELALVAVPDNATTRALFAQANFFALLPAGASLRDVDATLRRAANSLHDKLSRTSPAPSLPDDKGPPPDQKPTQSGGDTFEVRLNSEPYTSTPAGQGDSPPQRNPYDLVEQFSRDEPPQPTLEEGGTLGDVLRFMRDTTTGSQPVTGPDDRRTPPTPPSLSDDGPGEPVGDDTANLALVFLRHTLEDSTPIPDTLDKFFENLSDDEKIMGVMPLPSWVERYQRHWEDPEFLGQNMPTQVPIEYTGAITLPSDPGAIPDDLNERTTEKIEPVVKSHPPTDTAAPPATDQDGTAADDKATPALDPEPEAAATPEKPAPPPTLPEVPQTPFEATDARATQLAVTLTQMSLETTAEATLLIKDNRVVAYAGDLAQADIQAIAGQLGNNLEAGTQQARIIYVRLESTGKEYILYARRIAFNYTLAMIFAGTLPVSHMRQQSDNLQHALEETRAQAALQAPAAEPEPPAEPEPEPDPAPRPPMIQQAAPDEPLKPYTFLWLLREPGAEFSDEIMQALVMGLDMQLEQDGWQVHALDVHGESVYLHVSIPESAPPRDALDGLMQRTADIVHGIDPTRPANRNLWADAYLIVSPGRELDIEAQRHFIRFVQGDTSA